MADVRPGSHRAGDQEHPVDAAHDRRPTVGALNIYSDAERAFGTSEQELAALFATQASGILADAGADAPDEARAALLADSLRSREVIAVAQGILMERAGITQDDAAGVLHREARAAELTVRQHAADVVGSTQRSEAPGPPDGDK